MTQDKAAYQQRSKYLENKYGQDWPHDEHLNNLHARLKINTTLLNQELENTDRTNENALQISKHLHGTIRTSAKTSYRDAINSNTQKGIVAWLERVTDEEYNNFKRSE